MSCSVMMVAVVESIRNIDHQDPVLLDEEGDDSSCMIGIGHYLKNVIVIVWRILRTRRSSTSEIIKNVLLIVRIKLTRRIIFVRFDVMDTFLCLVILASNRFSTVAAVAAAVVALLSCWIFSYCLNESNPNERRLLWFGFWCSIILSSGNQPFLIKKGTTQTTTATKTQKRKRRKTTAPFLHFHHDGSHNNVTKDKRWQLFVTSAFRVK